MVSRIPSKPTPQAAYQPNDRATAPTGLLAQSYAKNVDPKMASSPTLPFIREDTVEAVAQHVQEKFQGNRGILSFGYRHDAVPFQRGATVPGEKYFADNLEAIVKANNITTIAMESPAEGIDKPAYEMGAQQEEAQKEFTTEIEAMSQRLGVDPTVAKLVAYNVLKEHFNSDHQSVGDFTDRSASIAAKAVTNALEPWLSKLPGMAKFFEAPLNERNSFEEFHKENLLFQKAKELGIKMVPVDAPIKERTKGPLYNEFKLEFGKLFTIAYLLYNKQALLPQMPDFLKKDRGYSAFIDGFKQLGHDEQKRVVDNCTALFQEVSNQFDRLENDREAAFTANLKSAFDFTNGNVMTAFGSFHAMKTSAKDRPSSAVKQVSDQGVPTVSIALAARDHEADTPTYGIVPESKNAQYLRTNCHDSFASVDLSHRYCAEDVKLRQAFDGIVILPKLAT